MRPSTEKYDYYNLKTFQYSCCGFIPKMFLQQHSSLLRMAIDPGMTPEIKLAETRSDIYLKDKSMTGRQKTQTPYSTFSTMSVKMNE